MAATPLSVFHFFRSTTMPTPRFMAAKACALAFTVALPLFAGCVSKAPVGCSGPLYPINDRALSTSPSDKP